MKYTILLTAAALLGTAPVPAQVAPSPEVLATINGEALTLDRLLVELERIHSGMQDTERRDFDLNRLVERMINERLMIQDAQLLDFDQEPDFLEALERKAGKLAVARMLRHALPETAAVSAAEADSFYFDQFRPVRLFTLYLKDRRTADKVAARAVKTGNLEELAAKHGQDQYRYGGGDHGFKRLLDLDAGLRDQVAAMRPGEVRGPSPFKDAFRLVQLLEEKPADSTLLDFYRPKVQALLKRDRDQADRVTFMAGLRLRFPVEIHQALVDSAAIFPDSASAYSDGGLILARVGPGAITLSELRHLILRSGGASRELAQRMKAGALEGLIQEQLQIEAARADGFLEHPEVQQLTGVYADSLLIVDYLEQVVAPQVKVEDAAVDSFYQANREWYRTSGEVKYSQITVAEEDSAREVVERLAGGADFAWLAGRYSVDAYAVKGGERGWVVLETLPEELRKQMAQAAPGQILGPAPVEEGWGIFRVDGRKPGEIMDLARARGLVGNQLYQAEFHRTLDRILAELRDGADLVIHQQALEALIIGAQRGN
ncbi:MAG: hypothetical protein C4524_07645 [Candidatus Zixiibacteriota bacterium]|nr:MAG: hypothetical protein C4524_07645 [candidate division Zixibacteria bacterium]